MPELGSEDLSSFLTLLSHVSRIDEQTSLSDTRLDPLRHLKTPRLNKKSPRICLQALLSHHIYSNIIGASFFGFEGAGALYAVYDDLLRGKFPLRRANPTGTELSQSTRRRPMPGDRRWFACYAFHPKTTQSVNPNKQQMATELSERCSVGAWQNNSSLALQGAYSRASVRARNFSSRSITWRQSYSFRVRFHAASGRAAPDYKSSPTQRCVERFSPLTMIS